MQNGSLSWHFRRLGRKNAAISAGSLRRLFEFSSPLPSSAVFLVVGSVLAQAQKVTPLLAKNLADIPGKEATMFSVEARTRV